MVRRYLNKHERQDMVILAAFVAFLENRIGHWIKLGRSKEKIKYARTCYTFANKVLKFVLDTLEPQEKAKVIDDITKYSIGAYFKTEAQREYDYLKKLEENTIVQYEDFYDLADHALVICGVCKDEGSKVEECRMRKLFIKYGVPVFDQFAPEGTCPFKQIKPKETEDA